MHILHDQVLKAEYTKTMQVMPGIPQCTGIPSYFLLSSLSDYGDRAHQNHIPIKTKQIYTYIYIYIHICIYTYVNTHMYK